MLKVADICFHGSDERPKIHALKGNWNVHAILVQRQGLTERGRWVGACLNSIARPPSSEWLA